MAAGATRSLPNISIGGSIGPPGPIGPQGAQGQPAPIAPYEGFSVHLDNNFDPNSGDPITGPWAIDFSSEFFTSPSFNLATGVYTVPESGTLSV